MDRCPACGAPTDPADRFCGRCGASLVGVEPVDTRVARFCRGCGEALEADARFCRRCGARAPEPAEDVFAGMQAPAVPQERLTAPTSTPNIDELFVAAIVRAPDNAPTESIPRPATLRPRPRTARPRPAAPPVSERPTVPARSRPEPRQGTSVAARTAERTRTRPAASPAPRPHDTSVLDEPDDEDRRDGAQRFAWGGTLPLLGGLIVIASSVLDWGGPFRSSLPRDIGAWWLWAPTEASSGASLGVVLLVVGTLGALVALLAMASPALTFLRRLVGVATLMVPLAFALRTAEALANEGELGSLPSALRIGVLVAAVGGLLQLLAPRPARTAPG